jgi:hypothetical protein
MTSATYHGGCRPAVRGTLSECPRRPLEANHLFRLLSRLALTYPLSLPSDRKLEWPSVTQATSIVLELQVTGYRAKQHTVTSYTLRSLSTRQEAGQKSTSILSVRGTGDIT